MFEKMKLKTKTKRQTHCLQDTDNQSTLGKSSQTRHQLQMGNNVQQVDVNLQQE